MAERRAKIHMDGWAGRTSSSVFVVGETAKRYRIRTAGPEPVRLAGRSRYLRPGETKLVPKHAVTFDDGDASPSLEREAIVAYIEGFAAHYPGMVSTRDRSRDASDRESVRAALATVAADIRRGRHLGEESEDM